MLLVSPDPTVLKRLRDVLGSDGFDVLTAETGQKALRTLRDYLIDVVVLDHRTPFVKSDASLENSQTLVALTDASPFLPVVLVCGATGDLEHATSLMADIIVTRPVESAALLDAVDTVLEETLRERAHRKAGVLAVVR